TTVATDKPSVETTSEPKAEPAPAVSAPIVNNEKPPVIDTKSELTKDAKSDLTKSDSRVRDSTIESVTTTPTPQPTPSAPPADDSGSDDALKALAARVRTTIRITGRVLDGDKNGLSNVAVVLISPSGSVLAATTNNEGIYTFTVAPSLKTYRVIPSKDGFAFAPIDKALTGLRDDRKDV